MLEDINQTKTNLIEPKHSNDSDSESSVSSDSESSVSSDSDSESNVSSDSESNESDSDSESKEKDKEVNLEFCLSKLNLNEKNDKIINKGTGAGGANTNKNGLSYEKLTNLDDMFVIIEKKKYGNRIEYKKKYHMIQIKRNSLFKFLEKEIDKNVEKGHGCKNPDECFVDEDKKIIFIIEKKFQNVPGSVCEKIQTSDFKIWQYNRTFPNYQIVYMYCLSDWFKNNCKAELEYLNLKKIPIFWGKNEYYKTQILDFMINYESTIQ